MSAVVTTEQVDDNIIYTFSARELTIFNTGDLEKDLNEVFSTKADSINTVTFDLKAVEYIDSTAMSFLVKNHIRLSRENKKLILKNLRESVKEIFIKTRLDKDFNIV